MSAKSDNSTSQKQIKQATDQSSTITDGSVLEDNVAYGGNKDRYLVIQSAEPIEGESYDTYEHISESVRDGEYGK